MKKNTKKLCKCCQTSLQGKFCWKCGQQDINENAPFFEYVNETLDENFGLNGTIVKTIKTLMTKPGHLTKLYSQGIRTGYVKPAKLLLTMTIFFVLFNSFFDISEVKFLGTFNPTTFVPETISGSYSMEECESSQTNVKALYQAEYNQKFQTLIQTAFNDETITYQLTRMMRGYIWGQCQTQKAMIVNSLYIYWSIIPLLSILSLLLFKKLENRFLMHLVYWTHFSCFIVFLKLLFFYLAYVLRDYYNGPATDFITPLILSLYFFKSLSVFLSKKFKDIFLKSFILWIAVFMLLFVSTFAVGFLVSYNL